MNMTFGRMNNMRRRSYRPDESFHRNRRRRQVDRSAMLEPRRRQSGFGRLLGALLGMVFRH
jgi:hypothetical protein